MKTELRFAPHSDLPGEMVAELWYDGRYIGNLYGADGPGVRLITKHPIEVKRKAYTPNILEFVIDPTREDPPF